MNDTAFLRQEEWRRYSEEVNGNGDGRKKSRGTQSQPKQFVTPGQVITAESGYLREFLVHENCYFRMKRPWLL